jgi:hypothetical protein
MSDFVVNMITSSAVSIALVGMLSWLFRSWISERLKNAIKSEYDLKLESHKAMLKTESDASIERIRFELETIAHEHRIRYEKLHERRINVIAKVYGKLHVLMEKITAYTKPLELINDKPQALRHGEVVKVYSRLRKYYMPNQIFIPEETANHINEVLGKLAELTNQFHFQVERSPASDDAQKKWMEILNELHDKMRPILFALKREFRLLLGGEKCKEKSSDSVST